MSDAAATIALAEFRDGVAPEFGPTGRTPKSDDEVLKQITRALRRVTVEEYGEDAPEATAELAAHKLVIIERRLRSLPGFASTGPVASVGVKGASFSHTPAASPSNSHQDDELRQTTHGLAFLSLRDQCVTTFGVFC